MAQVTGGQGTEEGRGRSHSLPTSSLRGLPTARRTQRPTEEASRQGRVSAQGLQPSGNACTGLLDREGRPQVLASMSLDGRDLDWTWGIFPPLPERISGEQAPPPRAPCPRAPRGGLCTSRATPVPAAETPPAQGSQTTSLPASGHLSRLEMTRPFL